MAVTSVTVPKTLGVWTTTQAVSASMAATTAASASTAAAQAHGLDAGGMGQGVGGGGVVRMQAAREHRLAPRRVTRAAIITASAQAVEPSYMEALATGRPGQGRDLGLEFEQDLQACPGRSRAGRACSW